jgi:hypothetical protein
LLTFVVAVFFAGYSLGERKAQREAQQSAEGRKQDEGKLGIYLHHGDVNVILPSAGSDVAAETSNGSGDAAQTFSFYGGLMR